LDHLGSFRNSNINKAAAYLTNAYVSYSEFLISLGARSAVQIVCGFD